MHAVKDLVAGQPYFLAVEVCWSTFACFEGFEGWKAMSGKMTLFMKICLQGFGFQLTKLSVAVQPSMAAQSPLKRPAAGALKRPAKQAKTEENTEPPPLAEKVAKQHQTIMFHTCLNQEKLQRCQEFRPFGFRFAW